MAMGFYQLFFKVHCWVQQITNHIYAKNYNKLKISNIDYY